MKKKDELNISQDQLLDLINQVRDELQVISKSEAEKAAKLAKAEESSPSNEDKLDSAVEPSPVSEDKAPEASPLAEDKISEVPEDEIPGEEPNDQLPEQSKEKTPEQSDNQEEQGPSFDELVDAYQSLPPEDLQSHLDAILQVIKGQNQAERTASPSASPSASSSPSPYASPSASPAGSPVPQGPEMTAKSEREISSLKAQIQQLKKSQKEDKDVIAEFSKVVENLNKMVAAPARKAVTGIVYVPMQKSEERPVKKLQEMSKAEIFDLCTRHAASMSKSERSIVNSYVIGNVGVDSLAEIEIFKKVTK